MKKIHKILIIVLLIVVASPTLKAQDNQGLFISTYGELPSINLNRSNIIFQQYNIGIGYAFPKNIELLLNVGAGVLSENSKSTGFAYNTTSFGLGVNYLYPISPNYKLGVELLGAIGGPNDVGTNYDFTVYQGGIKVQSKDLLYVILGVRYRSFTSYNNNSLELFYGIGMRVGVKKK